MPQVPRAGTRRATTRSMLQQLPRLLLAFPPLEVRGLRNRQQARTERRESAVSFAELASSEGSTMACRMPTWRRS